MIGSIVKSLISPVSSFLSRDQDLKKIEKEGNLLIAKSKIDLKIAKIQADIDMKKKQFESDTNYDLAVLRNRRETIIDEVIILFFLFILALTFIPFSQDYMANGWYALNEASWWFEFGIVGILVSTLGLKDILRMFLGNVRSLKKKG